MAIKVFLSVNGGEGSSQSRSPWAVGAASRAFFDQLKVAIISLSLPLCEVTL